MAAQKMTVKDAHALINAIAKQAIGENALTAVDTTSFIAVGQQLMDRGYNAVIEALGSVMGQLIIANRPYKARLRIMNDIGTGVYTHRFRKISYYTAEADFAGFMNTDLKANFAKGYDNGNNGDKSTASMWVQTPPMPFENDFDGSVVWQDGLTIYEKQLQNAFRGEDEFIRFMEGVMMQKGNEIELQKESYNRALLLNVLSDRIKTSKLTPGWDSSTTTFIGANNAINLTELYNKEKGTTYTTKELLYSHSADFLKFFVAKFKKTSKMMMNLGVDYHRFPAKYGKAVLTRHTPADRQNAILLDPLFIESRTEVLPDVFNPEYLKINDVELVDFWQVNSDVPTTEGIPTRYGINADGTEVPVVLGILYDIDAMYMDFQLEDSNTTPLEARKKYRNIWWSFMRNGINDNTENAVVFYMADPPAQKK